MLLREDPERKNRKKTRRKRRPEPQRGKWVEERKGSERRRD